MKTKISPTLVGMFVIGAVALVLIALLSFGGINFFSKPQRFVVYFDESIHGLDLGSPVKLRGVRVGRVVDLNVQYDAKNKKSVVEVICEFSRSTVKNEKGAPIDVSERKELQKLIDSGLRAQLGVSGLATGLLFVELDFVDVPTEAPPVTGITDPKFVVVPSVPSAISEFQASLTEILTNLKRVDFAGLSREMNGLLADTRKQISGLELTKLSEEWTKAGTAVNTLVSSGDLQRTFAHLNETIDQVSKMITNLDTQVQPAGVKLNETLGFSPAAEKLSARSLYPEPRVYADKLKYGDVVEVAPQYDANTSTAHAAAQVLFEILALMVFSPSIGKKPL